MKAMGQRSWAQKQPLELLDLPVPEPKPDEVRVRVAAIGVNPVDWKMREGGPIRLAARLLGPSLPFVPGLDFAGTVEAVGAKVSGLKIGDRVAGGTDFSRGQRGSYAECVTARPDQLCRVPDNVSLESAGGIAVAGCTAWMSVIELGQLAKGGSNPAVLILGAAGGVGQFAVQIAKLRGAQVVAVCSAKNVELVRALGADTVLDYGKGDALAQARPLAPYQVVVDCVGGYSASGCRDLLSASGRHIMVAAGSSAPQMLVPPFKSKNVLGRATTERLTGVMQGISSGQIKVAIAERFPLAEAEKAHAMSRLGRTVGKLLLIP